MPTTMHPPLAEPGREHLHHAVGSDSEQAREHRLQVLFEDRMHAEEAVESLQELQPMPWDSISITPAPNLTATVLDESFERDASGTLRSAVIAAAIGAIGGALLGMVLDLGLVTAVAVALLAFGMAGFGAIAGGLIGLARTDPLDDDPHVLVVAGPDAAVVTLRHLRPHRHHRVLVALGGIPIEALAASPPTAGGAGGPRP
jgi:hypothetical protein